MKNRSMKLPVKIRLPELEIHGICENVLNWMSGIRNVYWLIGIIVILVLYLSLMPHYLWTNLCSGIKAQGPLAIIVLFFSLTAVSLVWSKGQSIDVWVFMYFNTNERHTPWLDWTMLGLTQIGNGIFAMMIAFIFFLRGDHLLAYEFALGTLTLWLVVELIKILIQRTRPYIKLNKIRIVGSRASGYSFPSGHTSQTFFMATLVTHYFAVNVSISLVLYLIAVLVGITRIYVGMHYPRDVLGGAIFGTGWGLLGVLVNNYILTFMFF